MAKNSFAHRFGAAAIALVQLAVLSACNIKSEEFPSVTGPSEFGLSLTLAATPDTVPRDGGSQSVVTVTARNAEGRPVAGQRVAVGVTPGNGGALSATEVVTGPDGRATFEFTAPLRSTPVTSVSILATPVGQNFDNSVPRSTSIRLVGPPPPVPAFTVTPSNPEALQLVTFDASATTVNDSLCADACTYAWSFGNESNATGRVVTYRFQNPRPVEGGPTQVTYRVVLTVTSRDGLVASTSQDVVVVNDVLTPAFTFSPVNPRVGDLVRFDGRSSKATAGAAIVDYQWDFGDGHAASGERAENTFAATRIYTVRLTVRDSFGRSETTTREVTVSAPLP
jgi:PKD repeat protein